MTRRNYSNCKRAHKCINKRQGALTADDYHMSAKGRGRSLICRECYALSREIDKVRGGTIKPVFGSMTRADMLRTRWDVRLCQAYLLGRAV